MLSLLSWQVCLLCDRTPASSGFRHFLFTTCVSGPLAAEVVRLLHSVWRITNTSTHTCTRVCDMIES